MTYPQRLADFSFFSNGKKLYEQYFKDLRRATDYICVSFYIVKDDEHSRKFLRLLQEKSEQGLDVYLLVDRIGSSAINRKLIQELKLSGVHFAFSNKFQLSRPFYSLNRRNHRKITIIDGEIAYVGGFNVGDEYINNSQKFAGWRDYHIRAYGEVAIDFANLFSNDWEENCGFRPKFSNKIIEHGKSPCRLVPSNDGTLEKFLLKLLSRAEHSIEIGTPYFIPSQPIMDLLLNKLKDGVEITILYPHEADHPFVKEASIPYIKKLRNEGAKVLLFTKGFYHAKILFVDDKLVDIGTANFDRRSLYINDEVNLIIYDKQVIEEIHCCFKQDLAEAMPLDDDWINYPNKFIAKIKILFAKILKPLL